MNNQDHVREAKSSDLDFIKEWLSREERDGRGFIHNWGLIEEAANDGQMSVFDSGDGAVAFLTFGISRSSILQVRSDRQRLGIGRALVECAITREESNNNAVLVTQCEPKSSVEFWARMGFEAHRDSEFHHAGEKNVYMQRLSTRAHHHIHGDDLELLQIRVYHERVLYEKIENVSPDRVFYVMAQIDAEERVLHLSRRISIPDERALRDPVVEVLWFDQIFLGKAKHDKAKGIGLVRTPNLSGWYIDTVKLPIYDH